MDFLQFLLILLGLGLIAGGFYYYKLITGFKKLIQFEQKIKKNPNDALVKQYMILYKKTFFPKKDNILKSRAAFYHEIKASPQVSYDTKRALRHFLEAEGVNILAAASKTTKTQENEINQEQ